MRIVVIGDGSIAKKLKTAILDNEPAASFTVFDEFNIHELQDNLEKQRYDCGLVCSPTGLHLEHCLALARNSIPFFCEKPLYHPELGTAGLEELKKLSKYIIHMVGCNLRFTDEVKELKARSDVKGVVELNYGYNLAKWHNDGKHKLMYSANKHMGGGVTWDLIHEYDYAYYCFGKPSKITTVARRLGDVTVDTEDTVDAVVEYDNLIVKIHLDYLNNTYTRYYKVNDEPRVDFKVSSDMYKREMKYFLDNLKKGDKCINTVDEADLLLKMVYGGLSYE